VCLSIREPTEDRDQSFPPPFLARELVRQAFLIAARDGCGLATRDATLHEDFPSGTDSHSTTFEMFCEAARVKKTFEVRYVLSRVAGTSREKLWEWTFITDIFSPNMIIALAEKADVFSREGLKQIFKRQGFGKSLPPFRATSDVPREAQDRLWKWNEIAILAGLRQLHAEIRQKGESPELVAAFAVGYANLASLCEHHYGPAHKAFAARALLYAQRLLRKTDGSAWALWHRAYVRTLIGLHNAAAADVAAAKKEKGSSAARPLPFWTETIDLFSQGHLPRMLEAAKTDPQQHLARYLNLLATMYANSDTLTLKAGEAVIEACPECLRAADAICSMGHIGVMRMVTSRSFSQFSEVLRTRLPDVPGLPDPIARRIRDTKPAREDSDEVEFRVQLVEELKHVSPENDRMEPSLSAVAHAVEEIEFKQLMRRLELERNVWGVPTDETIATYRPLCEHHRYAAYVDAFSTAKNDIDKAAQTFLRHTDTSDFGYLEFNLLQGLRRYDERRGRTWVMLATMHADPVFRDEMVGLRVGAAGPANEKKYNDPYMKTVWETSSKLPGVLAWRISRDWKHARTSAGVIERDFADDPIVIGALMFKYVELNKFDDAERCAKLKIRLAPDYASYNALAKVYKKKGDIAGWKATLEKSISLPSLGLEAPMVQNRLALYHMKRKEWKEAVVYADAAAQSYAAWAMLTSARCHEMLGEWEKSEEMMHRTSERYDDSSFDWMVWCIRTGHGKVEAADNCARKHFESLGTSATPRQLDSIGTYYLFKKEPEKALAVFQQAFKDGKDVYAGLHAALIADSQGNAAERDALLAKIIEIGKASDPTSYQGMYAQVAERMQKSLAAGNMKDFDYKDYDTLAQNGIKSDQPTNMQYFLAVFLKNRNELAKSREYLLRSADSTAYAKYNFALACQALRELKVPIPTPTGPELISEED